MMKNNNLVPIVASIGIGAATYYSIKKSNHQNIGQTVQKMLPVVTQISNLDKKHPDTQTLGPHGMS